MLTGLPIFNCPPLIILTLLHISMYINVRYPVTYFSLTCIDQIARYSYEVPGVFGPAESQGLVIDWPGWTNKDTRPKSFKHFVRNGVCLLLDCCFIFLYLLDLLCVTTQLFYTTNTVALSGFIWTKAIEKMQIFSQLLYDKFK